MSDSRQWRGGIVALALSALVLTSCSGSDRPAPSKNLEKITYLVPDEVLAGDELYRPVSVDMDESGRLYVLDAGHSRIYVYDQAGALQQTIGRAGDGPGEFSNLGLGGRLVVSHRMAFVLIPAAQRVQVFALPSGESYAAFSVAAWPTTIGFDGSELHLTMSSITGGLPPAAVYRYTLDGELTGTYGEKLRPDWDGPLASADFRRRAQGLLTVCSDGKVFHFQRWWPWGRLFQDGELVWQRWFDFEWLEDRTVARIFDWPRDSIYLDEEELRDNPRFDAMVLLDVGASDDHFFAFLNGSFLMVVDGVGEPRAMYFLGGPARDGLELPDERPYYPAGGVQLGVAKDGTKVCVPVHREAAVYCYGLGGQTGGPD